MDASSRPEETAAAAALGEVYSRTGHDVRGPAGNVVGALDLLERSLGAEVAGENADYFNIARRGVRRLLLLADRYTVLAEIERRPELSAQALDLEKLVRTAVAEASFVYGRSGIGVALELAPITGVASARWIAAAVMDAVMLVLRLARAQVTVQLAQQGGAARIVIAGDRGAATLEGAWATALVPSRRLDENALPIQTVTNVLTAHGGAARLERVGGEGPRIVLEWPQDASRPEGDA